MATPSVVIKTTVMSSIVLLNPADIIGPDSDARYVKLTRANKSLIVFNEANDTVAKGTVHLGAVSHSRTLSTAGKDIVTMTFVKEVPLLTYVKLTALSTGKETTEF